MLKDWLTVFSNGFVSLLGVLRLVDERYDVNTFDFFSLYFTSLSPHLQYLNDLKKNLTTEASILHLHPD